MRCGDTGPTKREWFSLRCCVAVSLLLWVVVPVGGWLGPRGRGRIAYFTTTRPRGIPWPLCVRGAGWRIDLAGAHRLDTLEREGRWPQRTPTGTSRKRIILNPMQANTRRGSRCARRASRPPRDRASCPATAHRSRCALRPRLSVLRQQNWSRDGLARNVERPCGKQQFRRRGYRSIPRDQIRRF